MKRKMNLAGHGLLLFLLMLPGCARKSPTGSATAPPLPPMTPTRASAVMEQTERFSEPEVVAAAALLSSLRAFLPLQAAQRCWHSESSRPRAREACLLAWAPGTDNSDELEGALAAACASSRPLAVAAIIRETPLRRIPAETLLAMLDLLREDPAWLRARAVRLWLKSHGPAEQSLAQTLLSRLDTRAQASPASLAETYRAAQQLGAAKAAQVLGRYCRSGTPGLGRMRCWRFLSAFVEPSFTRELNPELAAFLPGPHDHDWQLFERTFPLRALLLRPFLSY